MLRARELFNSDSPGGFASATAKIATKLTKLKPGEYRLVLIDAKQIRTLPDNAYYWGIVLKYVCEEVGESSRENMHEYLKMQFNADCVVVKGEVKIIPGSTKQMGVKEFKDFIEDIKRWILMEYGVRIPDKGEVPDEVYLEMIELGYVKP